MEPAQNTRASDALVELIAAGPVSVFELMTTADLNLNQAKRALLAFAKQEPQLYCLYMV